MVTPPRRAVAVTPRMEITPTTALQDVPLRIRVNGLAPSSRVKVAAEMTARDGIVWCSHAVFRTDGGGSVDVGSSGPVEGTYKAPSAMGLVWSMAREQAPTVGPPKRPRDRVSITFSASTEAGISMQTTVQRLLAAPGVTYRPLDGRSHLKGGWWLPPGQGTHPVVIVLGGSGGGADHDRAALYASHGFAALALAYFRAPGLPRGLVNIPLEYVGSAVDEALARHGAAAQGLRGRGGDFARRRAGATRGRHVSAYANEDWWPKVLAFITAAAAG
jgi:hypothetical protein